MPATKLGKSLFNAARQKQTFDDTVAVLMARKRIRTQAQLADRMHMSASQLSRRMTGGGWTAPELWRLIYILEPTQEELVRMMWQQGASAS